MMAVSLKSNIWNSAGRKQAFGCVLFREESFYVLGEEKKKKEGYDKTNHFRHFKSVDAKKNYEGNFKTEMTPNSIKLVSM